MTNSRDIDRINAACAARTVTGSIYEARYDRVAVDKAIRQSRKKIGKKEAALIHRVLRGREG